MLRQIINGKILTPQGWISGGSVVYEDGKILEIKNNSYIVPEAEVIDAQGMNVAPVVLRYIFTEAVAEISWKARKMHFALRLKRTWSMAQRVYFLLFLHQLFL